LIEQFDTVVEAGWLHTRSPIAAQVAAALAAFTLRELQPAEFVPETIANYADDLGSRAAKRAGVAD
jgi:hypothetical protein